MALDRYHYYLQCDTALAESVAVLQPLWKADIVQNVLNGLNSGGHLNDVRDHTSEEEWFDQTSEEGSEDSAMGSVGNVPPSGKGKKEKQADRISRTNGGVSTCIPGTGPPATEDLSEDEADEDGDHFDADNPPGPSRLTGVHKSERFEIPKTTGVGDANPAGHGEGGEHASTTGGFHADKRVDTPSINSARPGVVAGHGRKVRAASTLERIEAVPEGLKEGVQSCLDEACDAFRMSIRRAVLNYVLLDAKQRNRLGTLRCARGRSSELCQTVLIVYRQKNCLHASEGCARLCKPLLVGSGIATQLCRNVLHTGTPLCATRTIGPMRGAMVLHESCSPCRDSRFGWHQTSCS